MQYIPLRKSILKAKSTSSPGNNFRNILVFGGGTDTFDLALYLAKLISVIKGEWHFNFISNSKKSIEELDPRFEVMPFGKDLDKLVNISDLVITTASTSSLEIIAREIPLGVICVVDNQKTYYKFLTENGLAQGLGEIVESGDWQINLVKLKEILESQAVRNQMVKRMRGLIDMKGASRIVEAAISK
jgi:spore coat polysaccharide biosynthesis predicted glycosyltransferase SpsG